ncbi:hypothetical protein [Chryseolinea lacunae]|uniref:Uncharacterized protein n=1 Tax=Chryseolinea lacunae TaxID=2801331 RepID=A0ABS1KLY3_9BACT|nr:hypothetical protein [Chryseolinea lacunae]MBL0740344.1 hypothetical protein [Chryseolinea lacunae]
MRTEFFKLETVDRKVVFWLVHHVPSAALRCWMDHTAEHYRRLKGVTIDVDRLFMEVIEESLC